MEQRAAASAVPRSCGGAPTGGSGVQEQGGHFFSPPFFSPPPARMPASKAVSRYEASRVTRPQKKKSLHRAFGG